MFLALNILDFSFCLVILFETFRPIVHSAAESDLATRRWRFVSVFDGSCKVRTRNT